MKTNTTGTADARDAPSARECRLLRLLLWGRTVGEAAEALHLAPGAGEEMLAGLMRRQRVSAPRQLLTRALAHRWVR